MSLIAWGDAWDSAAWALYTWEPADVLPEEPPAEGGSGLQTRRRRLGRRLHWLTPLTQAELLDEIVERREAEFEELVEAKVRKLRRKPIVVALQAQPELRQTLQPVIRPAQVSPPVEDVMQAYRAAERSLAAVLAQAEQKVKAQKAARLSEEDDVAFVMAVLAASDD